MCWVRYAHGVEVGGGAVEVGVRLWRWGWGSGCRRLPWRCTHGGLEQRVFVISLSNTLMAFNPSDHYLYVFDKLQECRRS